MTMTEHQKEHTRDNPPPNLHEIDLYQYHAIALYNEEIEELGQLILDSINPDSNILVRGVCQEKGGGGPGLDLGEWINPAVKFITDASTGVILSYAFSKALIEVKKKFPKLNQIHEIPVKGYILSFYFPSYLDFVHAKEAEEKMMEIVQKEEISVNFAGGNHLRYIYDTKDKQWYIDN